MMISILFIYILALTFLDAEANDNNLTWLNPQKHAEKLIRDLNLFPELDVNIVPDDRPTTAATEDASLIVKTRFRFPYIGASSPGATVQYLGHHAGYYRLAHTVGARMYYFFFESRNKNPSAPVVIWLNGGPGCSSSLALFYENGPFYLANKTSLVWNDMGWDQVSNLIYVDQPTGTGFSYSSSMTDLRHSSDEAAVDLYDFLQAFFQNHPELVKNDFYITGESYAGHYIPAFAAQVHRRNKMRQGIHINLKGLAIGNGLTNPEIQFKSDPDYAFRMKIISFPLYLVLKKSVASCKIQIKSCEISTSSSACLKAFQICRSILHKILASKQSLNYYDIRKRCIGPHCYDFSGFERFLNQYEVQKALGVIGIRFVSCSKVVYNNMLMDTMKNYDLYLPALLQDGIKVLIYAGEYDLICNWLGNLRWVENVKWSGQKGFLLAKRRLFKVDNVKAGWGKSYGGLSFLVVNNAGHMVPMDQPKASLEMLRRWMQDQSL